MILCFCLLLLLQLHLFEYVYVFMSIWNDYSDYYSHVFGINCYYLLPIYWGLQTKKFSVLQITPWLQIKCLESNFGTRSEAT